MPAPDAIRRLVENFDRNRDTYKSGNYNETQVRVDFIDPMFSALGWDVHNKNGYAEAYRDVIHEFSLKMGATTKAPDYCFRIGQAPKFFLEAKKPAVPLKDAKEAALQLRRYAWSAKLPVSILTDFDEFAVYDCRVKPDKSDSSSAARTEYFTYDKYEDKWDEIASVFSKEAILQGSFDKYVESKKKKRGTAEVDEAFLAEIERWRDLLAKNINLRNHDKGLAPHELNEAVQKTIDRIIFLRICEDRGIEPYAQLLGLTSGDRVYDRLQVVFHRADERYNSGLFHFRHEKERGEPDNWTLKLEIDDKPLKEILKHLYYPDSPYEFSVLPADILGQVYEQFLGKVITPKGLKVTIEDKPEVKKAGGVYYTPTYIVDYIVEHTVGKLLEGKSPDEVAGKNRTKGAHPLRVLDPACGSGTFLIGAYQKLLDWFLIEYSKDPEKHLKAKTPRLRESGREGRAPARPHDAPRPDYRLTTHERKRILLDHIYGVDIDPQAVEVTKLSLLLKVLEGESDTTLNVNLQLFRERALPDLDNNIKCGNSLIGPDFYDDPENAALPEGDRRRINAFDWKAEFKDVFAGENPGFDAVIGNPPYIRMEAFKNLKDYLRKNYRTHEERADLYIYMLERATQLGSRMARIGMIVSNKFVKAKYGRPLRALIEDSLAVERIVDFAGCDVFKGATVRTLVIVLRNESHSGEPTKYAPPPPPETIRAMESGSTSVSDFAASFEFSLGADALLADEWRFSTESESKILAKIRDASIPLKDWVGSRCLFGIKTGLNDAFIIDERTRASLCKSNPTSENFIHHIAIGRDIRRYFFQARQQFVLYCHINFDSENESGILAHLEPYRKKLEKRAGKQQWFELQQPATGLVPILNLPKIIYPIIADECRFTLDESGSFINDKAFVIPSSDKSLLALLNSRLSNFYFASVCAALEGKTSKFFEFRAQFVEKFPVSNQLRKPQFKKDLEHYGDEMLSLHQKMNALRTPHDRKLIEREIERTDREIDRLVYELYGLTEAEIKIVEEATK